LSVSAARAAGHVAAGAGRRRAAGCHRNLAADDSRDADRLSVRHLAGNLSLPVDVFRLADLTADGVRNLAGSRFRDLRADRVGHFLADGVRLVRADRVGHSASSRFAAEVADGIRNALDSSLFPYRADRVGNLFRAALFHRATDCVRHLAGASDRAHLADLVRHSTLLHVADHAGAHDGLLNGLRHPDLTAASRRPATRPLGAITARAAD